MIHLFRWIGTRHLIRRITCFGRNISHRITRRFAEWSALFWPGSVTGTPICLLVFERERQNGPAARNPEIPTLGAHSLRTQIRSDVKQNGGGR
jgi:hypothetical protein